jgi:hypothetical protein
MGLEYDEIRGIMGNLLDTGTVGDFDMKYTTALNDVCEQIRDMDRVRLKSLVGVNSLVVRHGYRYEVTVEKKGVDVVEVTVVSADRPFSRGAVFELPLENSCEGK